MIAPIKVLSHSPKACQKHEEASTTQEEAPKATKPGEKNLEEREKKEGLEGYEKIKKTPQEGDGLGGLPRSFGPEEGFS